MTATMLRDVVASTIDADRPEIVLPAGDQWDELWADARDERAVTAFAQALHEGRVRGTDEQAATIVDAHEAAMRACLRLERVALDVTADLAAAGVETRVLKGPATARLDYDDPAWRSFGDVDLLVRSDDYDTTVDHLRAEGARRRSAEPRPGFDRRFGKGVCLIRPDGVQVDLHRTLAAGPFGLTIEPDVLFDGTEPLTMGDRTVLALDVERRFLHACFHAVLGDFPPRLTALRDVARMVRGGRVDLDRTRDLARRWRAGVVVASAVATAWSVLSLPRSSTVEWAFTYVPSRYERTALAAYLGSGRSYARQMAAAIPAIRGLRPKLSYASALLFADGSYVAGRDGGYVRRLRRAATNGFDTRRPPAPRVVER
jgi:hypothetical protein